MMKNRSLMLGLLMVSLAMVMSCKKPFAPAIIKNNSSFLVVEGVISTGSDTTQIKLSRTVALTDTTKFHPETKATVYIEDDKNNRYDLKEFASGIYKCAAFNTTNIQKCRLHIVTTGKAEYVSDYTDVLNTPPIDSIAYTLLTSGIQLSAYTHDSANKIKYFRWNFDETWEYSSYLLTMYKYAGSGQVVTRTDNENVHFCWINSSSNQILLASTENLSKSVINAQPITYIDVTSGKLQKGYSMLLKQYALDKEGFEYWQKLKKNTEQLGSIFDAQPSEIAGNIHNVANAAEPVIGYINASVVSSKRILIDGTLLQVRSYGYYPRPFPDECGLDTIYIAPAISFPFRISNKVGRNDSLIVRDIMDFKGNIIGYSYAASECVDCRLKDKNGKNIRPSYWPKNL